MAKEVPSDPTSAQPQKVEPPKAGGGPLGMLLPADQVVLAEARRLAGDPTSRVEDLATCIGQDPIIVIELLRVANAMFFSGGRQPITSTRTAAVRLGGEVLIETLDRLAERPQIEDEEVSRWFEVHRQRCRRASIISTILAQALARQLSDECQVIGLLQFVGEMIAVAHLKGSYTKLAGEVPRGSMFYRLAQDYKFDVEKMGVSYLRRQGIPDALLFVLDRESRPKTPDRAIMKPICQSAGDYVEAFDQNKLDKYSPGKTIPPKSPLRTLQMSDSQYIRVYERVAEFLYSFKLAEDKKKRAQRIGVELSEAEVQTPVGEDSLNEVEADEQESSAVSSEIDALVRGEEVVTEDTEFDDGLGELEEPVQEPEPTEVVEVEEDFPFALEDFSLDEETDKTQPRVLSGPVVAPPQIHTKSGTEYLTSITDLFSSVKTSEELLTSILQKLVKPGPFDKAALIVVSKDRKHAIVVASRGQIPGKGHQLSLDDPLNPLAQCFSKVQSFGNRSSKISPFGSKAFALAPLDVDHSTPVALYADCGTMGSLTFESRRIFRNVVELLNQKLPSLPGGILNELASS